MASSIGLLLANALLGGALLLTLAFALFLFTLPKAYSHFHPPRAKASLFTAADRTPENAQRSGYAWFAAQDASASDRAHSTAVQVVVLGDIGRSPRMQYHALSLAAHGARVELVGYLQADVHPDVAAHRFITVVPIAPFPATLQTDSRLLFLLLAPLKVLFQVWSLYAALSYGGQGPAQWMLVQNPPAIPTLAVAQLVCFLRNTRLVIDWHNTGSSILALRLSAAHVLVRISARYEKVFSRGARAHLAVSDAMTKFLRREILASSDAQILTLHDRPAEIYQPFTPIQRKAFLTRLPETAPFSKALLSGSTRLLVSSTSWTPDEDFSVLLSALTSYAKHRQTQQQRLPALLAIITGRGPQQAYYLKQIADLTSSGQLPGVTVKTAWLSASDYASLLASADLGISLHTSSSGVDLPMKVVDMFGAGLPVAGWSAFEAWGELVHEDVNGKGFTSAEGLVTVLEELFGGAARNESTWGAETGGGKLEDLRRGARNEGKRRWSDEWNPVAGRLFGLVSERCTTR